MNKENEEKAMRLFSEFLNLEKEPKEQYVANICDIINGVSSNNPLDYIQKQIIERILLEIIDYNNNSAYSDGYKAHEAHVKNILYTKMMMVK